jgi:RNA polymerase sigma-70 factor, ECF subfamily
MNEDALTAAIAKVISSRLDLKVNPQTTAAMSDEAVIDLVCDGNSEAFGVLVKRYEDFVFTLIRGIMPSDDTAKDITQEVFLRAYRAVRRFEKRSSFKTWLYRIAYNTSMSHLKRIEKSSAVYDGSPEIPANHPNQPLRMTLQKLIGMLKPELKAVVIFHYYDDLKYEEIAQVINCPVGTVKIRLFRAKHDLKELWEKYAIQLP